MLDGFDARRLFLNVPAGAPRSKWPTPALLYGLRRDILSAPWFADNSATRLGVLHEAVDALYSRGIDADCVVRYGFGDHICRAVVAAVASIEGVRYQAYVDRVELPSEIALPRVWATRIGIGYTSSSNSGRVVYPSIPFGTKIDDQLSLDDEVPIEFIVNDKLHDVAVSGAAVSRLSFIFKRMNSAVMQKYFRSWIVNASLDDLIAWEGDADYGVVEGPEEPVVDRYRWLVDRLAMTDFGRWRTSSLHLEWQWANSQTESPCDPNEMLARQISPSDIANEIALRAVASEPAADGTLNPVDHVADQALRLIEDDKRGIAAALFEAVCRESAQNAEAQNNYGFCLLPDDPAKALQHLELADSLGYENRGMNWVDQMQAHLLLGQPRMVLRLAEKVNREWDQLEPRLAANLWSFRAEGVRLINVSDVRPVAMALASEAERMLGGDPAVWDQRHKNSCESLLVDCECSIASPVHV